jgi:hypothetical protein
LVYFDCRKLKEEWLPFKMFFSLVVRRKKCGRDSIDLRMVRERFGFWNFEPCLRQNLEKADFYTFLFLKNVQRTERRRRKSV